MVVLCTQGGSLLVEILRGRCRSMQVRGRTAWWCFVHRREEVFHRNDAQTRMRFAEFFLDTLWVWALADSQKKQGSQIWPSRVLFHHSHTHTFHFTLVSQQQINMPNQVLSRRLFHYCDQAEEVSFPFVITYLSNGFLWRAYCRLRRCAGFCPSGASREYVFAWWWMH